MDSTLKKENTMNKSVKRHWMTVAAVSLAAGALFLSACSSPAPNPASSTSGSAGSARHLTIGVTVYNMSSFISAGQDGINQYAKDNDITIQWNSANNDVATQANQIDQYIGAGVDAILIVPVQQGTLQPQVTSAQAKKIPMIEVNTSLRNDAITASVLPDDVKAGEQEAQMMMDKLGGTGNVVILQGPIGSSPMIDRTQGINNVLAKYPNVKVLASDTADWDRTEAVNKMQNWISAFGNQISGVISENDDMGLGALQALTSANMTVPIVGIDGIQDDLNAVKNGTFIGTNLQNGTVELAAGLAVAANIARGQQMAKSYTYLMPEITQANVDAAMQNVVTNHAQFLAGLTALINQNLVPGGNIAYEGLPGQPKTAG
jgi:ribose transport system substrate-binding protein